MKVMTMALVATMCASSLLAAVDAEHLRGLPRGVQSIKYENGVISTLVVVGKKSVPKALQKNLGRASSYAGNGAREDAQQQFTQFLSTKCKWGKTANGETAMKEEAVSATDGQGNESSSESSSFTETEMSKEQKEQSAQACVSGIQALWEGMNGSGEWVWVGAWNAKAAKSILNIAKTNNQNHAEVTDVGEHEKEMKKVHDQQEIKDAKNPKPDYHDDKDTQPNPNNPRNVDNDSGAKRSVANGADEFL